MVDDSCVPVTSVVIEYREYLNDCGDGQFSRRELWQQPWSGKCVSWEESANV